MRKNEVEIGSAGKASLLMLLDQVQPVDGEPQLKCSGCSFWYPWLVRYKGLLEDGLCSECFMLSVFFELAL